MKHEPSYYDFDTYLALRNLGFARTRINELEQELKKARDMNANLLEENHKLHETILSRVYRSQSLKIDNPDDWIYCVLDGIESFISCTGANRMNKIRLNEYKSKVMEALDGLDLDSIIQATEMIASCKGIVWTFGNGQGLAVAESFALDLVKHAGIGSVNLNSPAMMSAYSNDYGFINWPSEPLSNTIKVGDLAVGFSFSGSPNILTALRMAIARKAKMILMTSQKSFDQNYMKEEGLEFIAHFILVPSDDIQVVEDVWSSICHMICNEVLKLK